MNLMRQAGTSHEQERIPNKKEEMQMLQMYIGLIVRRRSTFHNNDAPDWNITLVDTGIDTMTGGRLLRVSDHLESERFFCTYGDGLSNINIEILLDSHIISGCLATVTAVRPQARFGELEIVDDCVKSFKEKPQLDQGWINGGFFVLEPEVFDLISDDSVMFERQPLEELSTEENLMAYKHHGFWKCMDTKRDLEILNDLWNTNPPWFS